ncbi:hypothetical protein ACDN41_12205 [Priestia aryabhattai]|uniref:hypothetical protein n=1 Tax=Priestia aryabhattai TaxID=412384 RepID=UPI003531E37C
MNKNYYDYRLPNKKKWLLTDDFLKTFKDELDAMFNTDAYDDKSTYWNTYSNFEGTCGFYDALKTASEKHNIKKAIYDYACKLPWYKSDIFDSRLIVMMCERGIIEKGNIDEVNYPTEEELNKWEKNGEIEWIDEVIQYNGYTITKRDYRFIYK